VEITLKGGKLIIVPLRKYALEKLVAMINKSNIHCETDTGKPQGKEIW